MRDPGGKAVVITGAGRGLGRAYALALASEGARVLVNDVDVESAEETAALIRARGGNGVAASGSVAEWERAESLVSRCVATFGRIDALINNAAITRHAAPWEETEEDLRAVAETNILGVQFAARHAMRAMLAQGTGGSIINVVSGSRLGIRGMSSYGASKGAVASMTRNWAIEGRPHGIRVNAVSPLAQTPMAAADPRDDPPRLPAPDAIAPLVVALLSEELRELTGELLRFDGASLGRYNDGLEPLGLAPRWSTADILDVLRRTS